MPHSFVPLTADWPDKLVEALVLEAADIPEPEQERMALSLPRAELVAARLCFTRGLHAARITTQQGGYVAVWLEAGVEAGVDAAWAATPEMGFWLHALARSLCLAAMQDVAPEAAAFGCSPVPGPDPELAAELRLAGMECAESGRGGPLLSGRRYAVITPDPFLGGCGACALVVACPGKFQRNSTCASRSLASAKSG